MTDKKLSDRIVIDDARNEMTIDGICFSGVALDGLVTASPAGQWFRFLGPKNGVQIVQVRTEESFQ